METTRALTHYRTNTTPGYYSVLLITALLIDLITPILIWKGILPAYTRWISHTVVALMIIGAFSRMMVFDHIPRIVWLIIAISVIGVAVALFMGQAGTPTAWGWWIMFQFPLVGLFAYLQPRWSPHFPRHLRNGLIGILFIQVVIQVGQYFSGEPPGDNLAGSFGSHGTANLVIFIILVLCIALGRWLASGDWKPLVLVVILGSISSVLGEMKLFPFATIGLGLLAMFFFILKGKKRWRIIPYGLFVGLIMWGFIGFYDSVVVASRGTRPLESYLDPAVLRKYLGGAVKAQTSAGIYDIGRNYALTYGWNEIRKDPTTTFFGMGLGARGESRTLGIAGVALTNNYLGITSGTSLLVLMQEMGVVGLFVFSVFIIWLVLNLFKAILKEPHSGPSEVRYAVILFSVFWPLWLWYTSVWLFRVPMLIYWVLLGYVFSLSREEGT
jgi:hypothetical protein